jgi:hypothetical protein
MGPASSTEGAPSSNALSDGDISRLAMSIAQAVGDMVNRKPKEANHDSMGTTDRPEIHNSSSHRIASAVGTLSTRDVIAEPRSGAVGPGSSFSVPGACTASTSRINNNNEQLFDRRNTNFAQIGDSSSQLEPNPLLSQQGLSINTLPQKDFVSLNLRKDIVAGKDINLASLLIPEHKEATPREMSIGDETFTIKASTDKRLTRPLNIDEFTISFNKFKNIMCETYPSRRQELDAYHSSILKMHQQYGGTLFYEYHKQFSFQAAQYLIQQCTKIDWSIRDSELYMSIFTGQKVNNCGVCSSVAHLTNFCPDRATVVNSKSVGPTKSGTTFKGSDRKGRQIIKTETGQSLCNNYNTLAGCRYGSDCRYMHRCTSCRQAHPQIRCGTDRGFNTKPKNTLPPGKQIPTTN